MNVGFTVGDDVATTFKALKLKREYPWMFVGLNEAKDTIQVLKTGTKGQSGTDAWGDLVAQSGDTAGIVIFDHNNKLYFIYKCYDSLLVKDKMACAAMKSQIRNYFDGVSKDVSITEAGEFTLKYFQGRI